MAKKMGKKGRRRRSRPSSGRGGRTAPPRARFAAVTEGFVHLWRRLWGSNAPGVVDPSASHPNAAGGVGPSAAFDSNAPGVVVPSAATHHNATGVVEPSAASNSNATGGINPSAASGSDAAAAGDAVHFVEEAPGHVTVQASLLYTKLKKPRPLPRPPSPPPSRQLQVVDGKEVPIEQELQYREYCKRSTSCQGSSSLCHICYFEGQRCNNGIVRNSGMIVHCVDKHNGRGTKCEDNYCQVRFQKDSQREIRLHMHFSMNLLKDGGSSSTV